MNSELQVFNNPEFGDIRVLEIDGEPWWVLVDVCRVLGIANPRNVAARMDGDEKNTVHLADGNRGNPDITIVNEPGLYKVILRSDKPIAKPFMRWVTHEVIPSIRKTGSYTIGQRQVPELPTDYLSALRALVTEVEKNITLAQENRQQADQIMEMEPKASYYDVVLNCPDLISTSIVAKDYGKSAQWLNNFLHENGVQYKQGGVWLPYQKYADMGYTGSKTHTFDNNGSAHTRVHTYWTQRGRLFIYDLMKAAGIKPLMERELETEMIPA